MLSREITSRGGFAPWAGRLEQTTNPFWSKYVPRLRDPKVEVVADTVRQACPSGSVRFSSVVPPENRANGINRIWISSGKMFLFSPLNSYCCVKITEA
jgi:hypothetical protein